MMFFSDDMLHALAKNAKHAALPLAENSPQGASGTLTIAYLPICDVNQC
jgi:hypothetical protein